MAKILFATTAAGVKFYPVTITDAVVHIKGNTQKKLSEILDEIDYSGKADKVNGAVAGNFAGLDANGNLVDSGSKAADFKTKQTAVADPTAEGTGIAFIDSISQDANGEITVSKKSVQAASASQAGLESAGHFSKVEGIEAGAQVNILEGVKVNGSALTPDTNKAVDILIAEGDGNGQIKVNGANVNVHGLGTAAFTPSTDYDAAGAANAAKAEVIGESTDAKTANTINGAKAFAQDLANTLESKILAAKAYQGTVADAASLPSTLTADDAGKYYIVTGTGKFAYWNGASWDMVDQETSVVDSAASLVIGTSTKIAEVEGVSINVTQVEDMTKIEAVAVADTTEYADVTAAFTAPAGE